MNISSGKGKKGKILGFIDLSPKHQCSIYKLDNKSDHPVNQMIEILKSIESNYWHFKVILSY